MCKYAYLVMVTEQNNNKFYEILEKDGVLELYNGRVDVSRVKQESKPISDFDKILNSKLKKGYKNMTSIVAEKNTTSSGSKINYTDIPDSVIKQVVEKLLAYANKVVEENYSVKSNSVTQKQVDEAQKILNDLSGMIKINKFASDINKKLLELYHVIPRKMNHIKNYLLQFDKITNDDELQKAQKFFSDEQDTLDSMAGQVMMNTATADNTVVVENKTILDTLGIKIERSTKDDDKMIKDYLGELKDKFINGFRVVNTKSQKRFEDWLATASNKKTKLLWHGSRNQNWISILQNSLMIRPSGVITQGSMFGNSVYFANKAKKSYGYTSSSSARWTAGNSSNVYMALYDVHVGNEWNIYHHESFCYDLNENKVKAKGCDSVYAHSDNGRSLYNDEIMIYNIAQCTIKYLVELKG